MTAQDHTAVLIAEYINEIRKGTIPKGNECLTMAQILWNGCNDHEIKRALQHADAAVTKTMLDAMKDTDRTTHFIPLPAAPADLATFSYPLLTMLKPNPTTRLK